MAYKDQEKRNAYAKKWREANPEKVLAANRKTVQKNRERINARNRRRYHEDGEAKRAYHRKWSREHRESEERRRRESSRRLREAAISAYGGKCACCGEWRYEFLTIDHIYGDGRHDRKNGRSGIQLYRWLRNHGYPTDRFRLLCMNCNWARGKFGYCPHERVLTQANPAR